MKNNPFFAYSKTERYGIFTLLLLNVVLVIISFTFTSQPKSITSDELIDLQAEINTWSQQTQSKEVVQKADSLFDFDPNVATYDELVLLGFSDKVANNITKYTQKGGSFKHPEALLKIYGMDSSQYYVVLPYIQIKGHAKPTYKPKKRKVKKDSLFVFDPNRASFDELVALGIPKRVAKNMIRYRDKGGRFDDAQSLEKVYGMTVSVLQKISPYISIESEMTKPEWAGLDTAAILKERQFVKKSPQWKKVIQKIDINSADTDEWDQLPGIGPSYAKRILKFRDKLGGFCSIGQVGTVYHLPDSTFQKILPYLQLNHPHKKLDINQVSFAQLAGHPYIKSYQAKAIVKYRDKGKFTSLKDVLELGVFSEDEMSRLAPYLAF